MTGLKKILESVTRKSLHLIHRRNPPGNISEACKRARQYDEPVRVYSKKINGQENSIDIIVHFQDTEFPCSGTIRNHEETILDELHKTADCLSRYQGVVVIAGKDIYLPKRKYSINTK